MAMSDPEARLMPTSAALSAGASFTPSPVMPTTRSRAWSSRTICSFWSGVVREKTISGYAQTCNHWCSLSFIRSLPVRTSAALGEDNCSLCLLFLFSSALGAFGKRSSEELSLTVLNVTMPHCLAMARAVRPKSPVT
jgi:hypothetical protein